MFEPTRHRARAALRPPLGVGLHAGLQLPEPGEDGVIAIEIDPSLAEDQDSFLFCLPRTPLETDDGQLYH